MVLGWRRAFCTSIPRNGEPKEVKQNKDESNMNPNPSPRVGTKFGFFSNPSTPRLQSQPVLNPGLRCRTTAIPTARSAPESPKLQCKTKNSPTLFHRSNPSSPRSPSTFSLLKSSLRFSKSRCGICLQSVKAGQGMAIFTSECSHSFHFPCISEHVKKQGSLVCPVCNFNWKEMPILPPVAQVEKGEILEKINVNRTSKVALKVYNDDEPLMSPTTGARFNPIPESDEDDAEDKGFQGFFVNPNNNSTIVDPLFNSTNIDMKILPEAAVVSVGRSYETYAVVLRVKAPAVVKNMARRAPIDLVTVLDVSQNMDSEKLQMMKRAIRLILSSLTSSDRLSIVAFSSTSKRLLPLRRMTTNGRRSARRIIDALTQLEGTSSCTDAVKKGAKVLEDRREKNPAASIIVLTGGCDDQKRQSWFVSSTRYSHLEIPVHSIGFGMYKVVPNEKAFANCVTGLLSIVVQDLRVELGFVPGSGPGEISAVYSFSSQPVSLGTGSIRVKELYSEEEREVLVELKVPSSAIGAHHIMSVRSSYKDPSTQELIYTKDQALLVPRPHSVRSSSPTIRRLRSLFITTRALAESRRLIERNDLTGAQHMLTSARALLLQSNSASNNEFLRKLEVALSEHHKKLQLQTQTPRVPREVSFVDEKGEPLTPTSAWRAAEKLAKVAIMRKSLNRVSDLHGFEDARF